jgi:hypothetical protein
MVQLLNLFLANDTAKTLPAPATDDTSGRPKND